MSRRYEFPGGGPAGIALRPALDFDLTRFLGANRFPLRWKTL
jgi:hypothetical protein